MDPFPRWLKAVLALLFLALLAAGAWFYRAQTDRLRHAADAELQAIAQLKVDELVAWRAERLADATVLMEDPLVAGDVARWLGGPSEPAATASILARFRALRQHYGYADVLLADAAGQVRLRLSARPDPLDAEAAQGVATAVRERRPVLTDLHVSPGQRDPHLGVVAPVWAAAGPGTAAVGAVILECNARQFLYPLIQSWPTPSRTGETLLVRRDGDAVLFLNDLRHQRDTALQLRIPLTRTEVPAVMAVLGREGVVQGQDYRGVPVLSALKAVPGSPWFMVAKMDEAEALATLRREAMLMLALLLGLALAATAAGVAVWQRQRRAHDRRLLEAETARRRGEERHRVTLLSVGDGVIVTDAAGNVELLNPAAEQLTGWSAAAARGRPLTEVFHIVNEDTRQPVDNPVTRVLREGVVVGLANHTLLIAKDGAEHPIADSGAPIRDETGTVSGVVLVFQDQTAERRAEAERRQAEERFRAFFDSAPIGKSMTTADGRLERVNPALCAMLGYSQAELQEKTFAVITHPDDLAATREAIRALLAGERRTWDMEKRYIHRDGHIVWAQVTTALQRDPQGQPQFLLTHVLDITERQRAEAALKTSELRLRRFYESGLLGVIYWTMDGKIVDANDKFLEMVGYTRDDLLQGRIAWVSMTPPEYQHLDAASVAELKATGVNAKPFEKEYLRKDGTRVPILLAGAMLDAERFNGVAFVLDITERKRAEETLRASEERFRIVAETTNDVVYEWDLRQRIQWFGNIDDLLGYGPGEFPRTLEAWAAAVHPEDLERTMATVQAHLDGRAPYAAEYRIRRKDGAYRRWSARGAVARTPDGTPVRWIGSITDITARQRAAHALEASETRYRRLFEAAKDGILILDADTGAVVDVNPFLVELLGFPREYFLGRKLWDLGLFKDIAASQAAFAQLREKAYVRYDDLPLKTSDGRQIAVEFVSNVYAVDGQTVIQCNIRDITERQRAAETLRRLSARHQATLEAVPDIIMEVDANKVYTWANAAGNAFFGPDVLGQEAAAYFVGAQTTYTTVQPLFAGAEDTLYVESWQRRQDGEKRLLAWWCRVLKDQAGRVTGALSTGRDITEERQAGAVLAASLEEKTALLKEVHHRVKNNLQIVMSLLNLQAARLRSAPAVAALNETRNRVRAMALLHEKLYRSGDVARVDFDAYLTDLCTHLAQSFSAAPDRLKVEIDAAGVRLTLAQAVPCGLVVSELVSNALKHAFPGDRAGRVSVEARAQPDGRLSVTVSDDGVGLPADADLEHADTRGLELVRALAGQLKGTIAIERAGGTRVCLTFPGEAAP